MTTDTPILFDEPVYELDWRPRGGLPAEQLQMLSNNCCGTYVDPLAQLNTPVNETNTPETRFFSEGGLSQITQTLISIEGNVTVQQGNRYIINDDTTSINTKTDIILMDGNIVFREPTTYSK